VNIYYNIVTVDAVIQGYDTVYVLVAVLLAHRQRPALHRVQRDSTRSRYATTRTRPPHLIKPRAQLESRSTESVS